MGSPQQELLILLTEMRQLSAWQSASGFESQQRSLKISIEQGANHFHGCGIASLDQGQDILGQTQPRKCLNVLHRLTLMGHSDSSMTTSPVSGRPMDTAASCSRPDTRKGFSCRRRLLAKRFVEYSSVSCVISNGISPDSEGMSWGASTGGPDEHESH